jgi:hypothetical protein
MMVPTLIQESVVMDFIKRSYMHSSAVVTHVTEHLRAIGEFYVCPSGEPGRLVVSWAGGLVYSQVRDLLSELGLRYRDCPVTYILKHRRA